MKIKIQPYSGSLDFNKVTPLVLRALRVYYQQRSRKSVAYSTREFVAWWLFHYKRKKWKQPECGRINHAKGYSFGNIRMEEKFDNIRERNSRLGNPGRSHKKVTALYLGRIKKFDTKKEAALYFSVSEKTIYNHASGRTKQYFKFGPGRKYKVIFSWTK